MSTRNSPSCSAVPAPSTRNGRRTRRSRATPTSARRAHERARATPRRARPIADRRARGATTSERSIVDAPKRSRPTAPTTESVRSATITSSVRRPSDGQTRRPRAARRSPRDPTARPDATPRRRAWRPLAGGLARRDGDGELLDRVRLARLAAVARDALERTSSYPMSLEDRLVLGLDERAAHARAPRVVALAQLGPRLGRERGVEDREASTRTQRAERFDQCAALVVHEVDHAVGDDDVDGAAMDGQVLEIAVQHRDVRQTGVDSRRASAIDHLGREVDADRASGRADLARGFEEIASRPGAEVEHRLARLQLRRARPGRRARASEEPSPRAARRRASRSGPERRPSSLPTSRVAASAAIASVFAR